jgi:hypothetical protein
VKGLPKARSSRGCGILTSSELVGEGGFSSVGEDFTLDLVSAANGEDGVLSALSTKGR